MLRVAAFRIPVVAVAAAVLLSACASGATTAGGASRRTARPPTPSGPVVPPAAPAAVVPRLTLGPPAVPGAPSTQPVAAARTGSGDKVVYLTFDDGPSRTYTNEVLALLEQYHANATFFVIGRQTIHAHATLRAEYAAGNGVGNHTWDHVSLAHTSTKRFRSEVLRTQDSVKAATGHFPVCLRPPGGSVDHVTAARAAALGLRLQFWSIDTNDWKRPGAAAIEHRVLSHVHNGSVVLMHDGGGDRSQTVQALRVILRTLSAQGYRFAARCR